MAQKKKWPNTVTEARSWIDFENPQLSVREQCRLLGIHRSSIYYDPQPESEENLQFMRLMDEEHLKHPARGSRQMMDFLEDQGFIVNRKRVQRLMRKMGIEGLSPKRRTTLHALVSALNFLMSGNLRPATHCRVNELSSFSAALSQLPCFGVYRNSMRFTNQRASRLRLEGLVKGSFGVRGEVVANQNHFFSVTIAAVEQGFHLFGPVDFGSLLSNGYLTPTG